MRYCTELPTTPDPWPGTSLCLGDTNQRMAPVTCAGSPIRPGGYRAVKSPTHCGDASPPMKKLILETFNSIGKVDSAYISERFRVCSAVAALNDPNKSVLF